MTANQTVHDPICHMDIDIADAAGRSDHNGMTYYFCSPGCKVDFDADPEAALKAESEYDHSQPADHGMMMSMQDEAPAPAAAGTRSSSAKKPWWQFWK